MRRNKRESLKLSSNGGGPNAPQIPARLAPFVLKPALLPGEREAEYLALVDAVSAAFLPTDAIEWLWVKDIVDYTWQAQRLRRLKADLIQRGADEALVSAAQAAPRRSEAVSRPANEWDEHIIKWGGHRPSVEPASEDE